MEIEDEQYPDENIEYTLWTRQAKMRQLNIFGGMTTSGA